MKIRRRVPVFAADGGRIVFDSHREESLSLLEQGCVVVGESAGDTVISLRLTGITLRSAVRPGSFGIRREHVETNHQYGLSGGIVFSHSMALYEDLAAA